MGVFLHLRFLESLNRKNDLLVNDFSKNFQAPQHKS